MFLMRYIKEDRLLKMVCFCFLLSACNTFDKNGNSLSSFSEDGFENFKRLCCTNLSVKAFSAI